MQPLVSEFIFILDELELLEAHLETHKHFGWNTYICESQYTVSGFPKPMYFKDNETKFSRFEYTYVEIPFQIYKKAEGPEQAKIFTRDNDWAKRHWLHNNIKIKTPWAMHNDVDEIFYPDEFGRWSFMLDQDYHWLHHSLQNYVGKVNFKNFYCPQVYRLYRPDRGLIGPKGCKRTGINNMKPIAWHFNSCFSTPEQLRNKALNRAWYYGLMSPLEVPDIEYFKFLMEENKDKPFDPITRTEIPGRIVELSVLPKWMQNNIGLFPTMKILA